ncbi:MAG: DUF91 domain-containing protein [Firmicutes bacterium]|jgi:hypothetical protein|nr:DUF91 domain-containing protein [Bacillota bacterium]
MHESELHQVLGDHPELIEPGLRFLEYEAPIGEGLRCDILCQDPSGEKAYVEVKWTAGKRAVIQVEQYEAVRKSHEASRFILAALEAKPGIPDLLQRRGFEFKKIDRKSLLRIKPEWENELKMNKGHGRRTSIPPDMKDARLTVLHTMYEHLQDELPTIHFDHRGSLKDRLLIRWRGNDYFNFYFSNRVPDGFRFAFVVDLDQKYSKRRADAYTIFLGMSGEISRVLKSPVKGRIADEGFVQEGLKSWVKIMNHRWYSIYQMYRLPGTNWSNTNEVVEELIPVGYSFIEGIDSLLQRCNLPKE